MSSDAEDRAKFWKAVKEFNRLGALLPRENLDQRHVLARARLVLDQMKPIQAEIEQILGIDIDAMHDQHERKAAGSTDDATATAKGGAG